MLTYYKSPISLIKIEYEEDFVISLSFVKNVQTKGQNCDPKHVIELKRQLDEYFQGKRKKFNIPYKLEGTAFQKKVWAELCKIPYGTTKSYKEIALAIGNAKASRAIGNANNKNPLGIIIPCHRVIGANGTLVGYAGGVDAKEYLLNLEAFRID